MATAIESKRRKASAWKRKRRPGRVDRSVAPEVQVRAEAPAISYRVTVEWDAEGSEYYGQCVELPGALCSGATADACVQSVRDSVAAIILVLIEQGDVILPPRSAGKRTEMVNVRVSPQKKKRIEKAARAARLDGVSDYMRRATLQLVDRTAN
jgi:predicted RNase H-like HicB family nuclease